MEVLTKKGKAQKNGLEQYRFAFNGQEKVNEVNGIGNHNTALFWEYDTRLGRRWNLDPVDQVSISNYAAFSNNPIMYNDVLGDAPGVTTVPIPLTPKIRLPKVGKLPQARGTGLALDLFIYAGDKMMEHEEQMQQEAAVATVISSVVVGGILEGKIGDIAEKVDQVAQKTKTLVTDAVNKVANVILKAKKKEDYGTTGAAEHTAGARPSTKGKHQAGDTRRQQDRQGSGGMSNPPRKRPKGHTGPWPPKK